jgi:glycosyltransferase involved in cell wall biosynthesis
MTQVTVVLPTHNRAGTLPRAIASVLAQTVGDLSLVVVDDASTDDTPEVVASFADRRVRYVRLPSNAGPARARNVGIAEARTEWLAFQDSDDEWLPTKLEVQLDRISDASREVAVVIGGYRVELEGRQVDVVPEHTLAGGDPTPDILDGWPIITPTWLLRREALERVGTFDESLRCLEDWDLMFRISERYQLAAVRGPVLIKHSSNDSVFGSLEVQRAGLEAVLRRHGARWQGEPHRLARRLAHLGCVESALGQRRAGLRTLLRALRRNPGRVAYYGLVGAALFGSPALRRAQQRWPWDAGMALEPPARG